VEGEVTALRFQCSKLESKVVELEELKSVIATLASSGKIPPEMAASIAPKKKSAGFADPSPQKPEKAGKKHINFGGFSQDLNEVIEIENCVTGQKASAKSVKQRVQTGAVKKQPVESDSDEDSDDGGKKGGKIKFDAEAGTQEKNTAKKRVPTAFAKAPAEDSDDSDDGKKVKIQSEDGKGEAKSGKKRVPTAFVKPSAQEDSDEEDDRKVKIQAAEGTGEAKQGKKRVPTAFVKQPVESDEDDDEDGKKVTIQAEQGTGEAKSGKKRVPTAFVKPSANDDDEDDEEDGGRKVKIQAEGGAEGKTGKKRTPTAFVKPASVDDDDDDEEEERPHVKIADTSGGAEGKTGKKRTPTAFVKPTQVDDDDEDEDEEEAPRKVKISADGGGEGKTGKKRTPTAFVKRPPSDDEDEEEEGGRKVKISAEDGAGEAKGKKRTPTAFVKPSFADDDEDEDEGGKKNVSFNKRESVQMIEAAEGAEISGKLHSTKKRIPTAFKKAPVMISSEEDDDDEGELKFEIGKMASSKNRSVTLDTTVSDSESDPEAHKARAKARPSKGRIATAFIKKNDSSDDDDDDDDDEDSDDKPSEARKTEKKKKEKQKKLNFGPPSESDRRGSDEASFQGSESSKATNASSPAILLDNFEHYRVAKGEKDADLIENSLRGLEFFADIDDTACHKVVDALSVFDFPDGTAIAKQGNRNATHFFIVADGVFEIFRDSEKIAEVGKGKLLGESVILLNNAQNATVQCRGKAICYGMAGARARNILQQQYRESKADVHNSISGLLTDKACTCALLRNLSQGQETILYEKAEKVMFSAGTILTKQGDKTMLLPGKTERHGLGVYLLLNGGIVVSGIGEERQERHDYAVVGDLMMLYGEAPATVETSEASEFLLLTAEMLGNMFGDGPNLRDKLLQNRIQGLLAQYELFHGFSQVQLSAIATEGKTISLSEDGSGDEIVEDRVCLALVVSGENIEAQVIDEGSGPEPAWTKCSGVLGDALGMDKVEEWKSKRFESGALNPWKLKLKKTTHSNDCVVVWGSFLGTLLKVAMPRASVAADFEGSMNLDISPQKRNTRMASMKMAVMMDDKVGALRSVLVFRSLSAKQLSDLAATLEFQYATAGQAIFNQREEKADEFYIIQTGVLEVLIDGRRVRTLSVGDYVGERALLFSEPRSATVCAVEDSELWKINREDFNRIVTGAIIEYMKDRIVFQNTKVDIKSLSCLRVIGSGGYATVKMVYSSQTKTRYALKAISIKHMVQQEATVALCRERDILAELDHPFVLKFIRTFRSKQYVYYLIELVTGGELWEFVNERGVLTKDQTRFYVGSVVLALEFLHDRRIAYLDLKGENMLIDQFGYLKIIDFGLAERVVNGKIFEPKGTPFYMAPELFGSHGYSTVADLWSLGTLTFLWMTEDFPFNFQMEDQGEPEILVKKTLHEKLTFPSNFKDAASISFISGLLTRNPAERLGAGNSGYAEIKSHAFFDGFEFDQLLSRQLTPPWVPDREVYADNTATDANIIEDVGDITWEQVEVKGIKAGDATRACGIFIPQDDKEHNGLRYCKHCSEELYLYSANRDGSRWVVSPSLGGPEASELIENTTPVEERRIPPRKGWTVKDGMGSGKVKVKVEMDPDPSWMDEF